MGLKIGDKTKMDLAKEAIKKFIPMVKPNVSVGIMVYGNKGSNSEADKAASCASADMVAQIGSVTASSIDGYLSQIKPVGWTPIGLAIKKAKDSFVGKEGQKNQIIVVTDGNETCNTNPIGTASEAFLSPYKIKVDVIGFGVNNSEQTALTAISTSGGGLFSLATNADDLFNNAKASMENFDKFVDSVKCISTSYQTSIDCLTAVTKKVSDNLNSAIVGKKGAEYSELSTLQSNIYNFYYKKISSAQDEWGALQKAEQKKLLNQ